ncbi:MAG TPA: FAD-dependent oxidoreductase [Sphingomicrobium sp.]|nr:FAD-dependent oxidoreductase [Sphingomicrobium sp.]
MHEHSAAYDVVILGAGYAGLMAGLRLSGWTCPLKALLVSEGAIFTERVRLQESLIKPVAPRLPPLGQWLSETKVEFLQGRVEELHALSGTVTVAAPQGLTSVRFRRCIYALGSATDTGQAEGASRHAFRLDPGDGTHAADALRRRLLEAPPGTRIVVVGGGNTGVEAAAEIRAARPDLSVTIVAAGSAGDFGKGARVEAAVRGQLGRLGVLLIDDDPVEQVRPDHVLTQKGHKIAADICIWATGLRSPSVAAAAGLAVDSSNRIWVDGGLRSISHPRILAVGDAARPIAPTGAVYRQSALAALTTGTYAAASLLKEARGKRTRPFSFSAYGQGVAIGTAGVGFLTYPDDGDGYLVVTGRFALHLRNLFVRVLVWCLRIERLWPGLGTFWIGRKRVAWSDADAVVRELPSLGLPEFPSSEPHERGWPARPG